MKADAIFMPRSAQIALKVNLLQCQAVCLKSQWWIAQQAIYSRRDSCTNMSRYSCRDPCHEEYFDVASGSLNPIDSAGDRKEPSNRGDLVSRGPPANKE